jgi:riboflavin synthase
MFSGIVEKMGRVAEIRTEQSNKHFTIEADFAAELRVDQSVAHNGVCLTVVALDEGSYTVTAMHETLVKSNLGALRVGDYVNLERSMRLEGMLDGHIVQGHVDRTAVCTAVEEAGGSWYYAIEYDPGAAEDGMLTVEKGSVAVNGVSLTVVDSRPGGFRVAIIPYTHEHTNFRDLRPGATVNLEFDIIGKYVARLLKGRNG